jgi:transposase-like protein
MSALSRPEFQDAEKAREYLESLRWPNGPVCPHCGTIGEHWKLEGESHRPGLWKCSENACRQQFSVTVGTVFERSKIMLNVWLQAAYLMSSSKKGISAHQLHRTLGVTYKTAWFMAHRLREAMKGGALGPLGGGGKTVEADETYWGNKKHAKRYPQGMDHKMKIFALVERKGQVRSFHVPTVTGNTLKPILREHVRRETAIYTDEHGAYSKLDQEFATHETVNHGRKEYVRGPVHTNTIEGYFSILKRGLIGTYHHVSEAHLQRYVTEFDFRYNNRTAMGVTDQQRANALLKEIGGKRLTYRRTNATAQ